MIGYKGNCTNKFCEFEKLWQYIIQLYTEIRPFKSENQETRINLFNKLSNIQRLPEVFNIQPSKCDITRFEFCKESRKKVQSRKKAVTVTYKWWSHEYMRNILLKFIIY